MRDSKPCHPCLKAFEAAEKHENEKIRKLVNVLNWRGRNSTSSSFEFKVRGKFVALFAFCSFIADECLYCFDVLGKSIQVRQVMGGEHDTSKRLMEQPACKENDFLDGLGTGATCWPASLVLTKFLEKQWMHIYNRLQKSNKFWV